MINKELKARFDEIEKQYQAIKNQMKELEEKEQYPIYALSNRTGILVKFESLDCGVVIRGNGFNKNGHKFNNYEPHTNTDVWQILPVCEKTGLYHGQPVWACDEHFLCVRSLRFYDAINSTTFGNNGESNMGGSNDFYEPWEGEWQPWMVEAFKKLEL
jgi:hypothetical protein